jgi:hypothetical protein
MPIIIVAAPKKYRYDGRTDGLAIKHITAPIAITIDKTARLRFKETLFILAFKRSSALH